MTLWTACISWPSQAAHASQQGAQAGRAKQHMRLSREHKLVKPSSTCVSGGSAREL